MAQRTLVHLIDDLDGNEADETLTFTFDGVPYEIDLSKEHADELRTAIEPFVLHARRQSSSSTFSTRSQRKRRSRGDLDVIRAWARENGYSVSDRGRIAHDVLAAYEASL